MYGFNYVVEYENINMGGAPEDWGARRRDAEAITAALGNRILVFPMRMYPKQNKYVFPCLCLDYEPLLLGKLTSNDYPYCKHFAYNIIARYGKVEDTDNVHLYASTSPAPAELVLDMIFNSDFNCMYEILGMMKDAWGKTEGLSYFDSVMEGIGSVETYRARGIVKACEPLVEHAKKLKNLPVRFAYCIEDSYDYLGTIDYLNKCFYESKTYEIYQSFMLQFDVGAYTGKTGVLAVDHMFATLASGTTCILYIRKKSDVETLKKLLYSCRGFDLTGTTFVMVFDAKCSTPTKRSCKCMFARETDIPLFEIKTPNYTREEAIDELNLRVSEYAHSIGKRCRKERKWDIKEDATKVTSRHLERLFTDWKRMYNYHTLGKITNKTKGLYTLPKAKPAVVSEPKESPLVGLNDLIGLDEIKTQVEEIVAYHKMIDVYADNDMTVEAPSLHMAFYGNPGTAKTTCAKAIADIFAREGIIEANRFVKVSRTDLVGEYIGKTAPKTQECINKAKGGVLFVDEAYTLSDSGSERDFGPEALSTLVEQMDIIRHDTIVIFAGYEDKMKKLIETNEGLNSRVAYHMTFPDYTYDQLMDILDKRIKTIGFILEDDVRTALSKKIKRDMQGKDFGNGRYIRNLVDKTIIKHSTRVYRITDPSEEQIKTITKEDIDDVVNKLEDGNRIGFGTR